MKMHELEIGDVVEFDHDLNLQESEYAMLSAILDLTRKQEKKFKLVVEHKYDFKLLNEEELRVHLNMFGNKGLIAILTMPPSWIKCKKKKETLWMKLKKLLSF